MQCQVHTVGASQALGDESLMRARQPLAHRSASSCPHGLFSHPTWVVPSHHLVATAEAA